MSLLDVNIVLVLMQLLVIWIHVAFQSGLCTMFPNYNSPLSVHQSVAISICYSIIQVNALYDFISPFCTKSRISLIDDDVAPFAAPATCCALASASGVPSWTSGKFNAKVKVKYKSDSPSPEEMMFEM